MRLTESLLRSIIKQELKNVLNLSEGRDQWGNKRGRRKRQGPLATTELPQDMRGMKMERKNLSDFLGMLSKEDPNYMSTFVKDEGGRAGGESYKVLETFVGDEFSKAVKELVKEYNELGWKLYSNSGPEANRIRRDFLNKFKEIAVNFAPVRAGEGIVSRIARAASPIYSPSTKE